MPREGFAPSISGELFVLSGIHPSLGIMSIALVEDEPGALTRLGHLGEAPETGSIHRLYGRVIVQIDLYNLRRRYSRPS